MAANFLIFRPTNGVHVVSPLFNELQFLSQATQSEGAKKKRCLPQHAGERLANGLREAFDTHALKEVLPIVERGIEPAKGLGRTARRFDGASGFDRGTGWAPKSSVGTLIELRKTSGFPLHADDENSKRPSKRPSSAISEVSPATRCLEHLRGSIDLHQHLRRRVIR